MNYYFICKCRFIKNIYLKNNNMDNIPLKITAIERSIEQIQKSLSEKHPHVTISSYNSVLPSLKCRFAESIILRGHSEKVNCISWSHGSPYRNKILASVSSDGSIILWNAQKGVPLSKWVLENTNITHCKFEPTSGDLFVLGSFDGGCHVYNSNFDENTEIKTDEKPVVQFQAHDTYISDFSFLDSNKIATASGDKTLKLWDLFKPDQPLCEYIEHSEDVMCVDSSESMLISGSCDHSVKLWDIRTQKRIRSFNIHLGDVNAVKFISNYSFITGCADGFIRLLDIRGLNVLGHYRGGSRVESVESSYSGRVIFSSGQGDIKVWDIMNEKNPLQTLPRPSPSIRLHYDSSYLAGANEESIVLWQHVIYS